jgi:hypothetical protein
MLQELFASRQLHRCAGPRSTPIVTRVSHNLHFVVDAGSIRLGHLFDAGVTRSRFSILNSSRSSSRTCSSPAAPLAKFVLHITPVSHIARRSTSAVCSSVAAPGVTSANPRQRLADLDMVSIVNVQGYIQPEVPEGTQASVFAIYEQGKILQYIGFSRDLRSSLRTVFARRPDKAHFYRALHLPQLDQQEMIDIRTAWFDESGGPPPGNKLPKERTAWQSPPEALAISERGKQAAAEELAKQLLVKLRSRGCKEEFITDVDGLANGVVVFLAADALTPEELARQRAAVEAAAAATRRCSTVVDGETVPFDIFFRSALKTNGGHMFDVRVTFQEKETLHRLIVGKDYYEQQGLDPKDVVEHVFAFLLTKKMPRKTEGMLTSGQFPINYFAVSEVHQFFADFEEEFDIVPGEGKFWRFNRTEDYGYKGENEDVKALAAQFSNGENASRWKAATAEDGWLE